MLRRFLAILLVLAAAPLFAQQPIEQPGSQSTYTLNTAVRIVLTDVTVTDSNGNVVHGLPQSAFHVMVDKQPVPLRSFEENIDASTAIDKAPAANASVFSNEYLLHLPPVLNIVVLDVWNLGLVQQMSLAYEFNKFINQLPPDKPIALYGRSGDAAVLLQNFTSDHKLLLNAAAKVMPHFAPPGREYAGNNGAGTDAKLLYQIATDLSQIPGHKNVIWLSGGSPLISPLDPSSGENAHDLQIVYDMLETARASLYPVDARGLTVVGGAAGFTVAKQHLQMEDTAASTGGRAYYNRNFIDRTGKEILAADNSFYTLTFSPVEFKLDNKWHKIRITLNDSRYHLSYREGYFADSNNLDSQKDKPRTMLLAGGKKQDLPSDIHSAPIIFTASVVLSSAPNPDPENNYSPVESASPPVKRDEQLYTLRYSLPNDAFTMHGATDGRNRAEIAVTALAFNAAGEMVAQKGDKVTLTFPFDDPNMPIHISQQMPIRKGDDFLYIAVWDTTTGRLGTLQIPVTVK
jgi:VWFA-related protein